VIDMNGRMSGTGNSPNVAVGVDSVSDWLDLLPEQRPLQDVVVGDIEERHRRRGSTATALKTLDLRERDIIAERRLKETPATFEELSHRYAVSRERIRQIELRAISEMAASVARLVKKSLPALAFGSRLLVLECRTSAG
jgi:RNA polymerase sigma-32 factor